MDISFVEPIIKPEFESYAIENTEITINIGIETNHLNVLVDYIKRDWYLKDIDGMIIQAGSVDAIIGAYSTHLTFKNLKLHSAYFLEIYNPSYDKGTATIYTGNINSLEIKTENFVFTNNILVRGDLIFDKETRRVKLAYNWTFSRNLSNGIIFYQNKYYLFAPTVIFTTNKKAPEALLYIPFSGIQAMRVPIVIMCDINALGNGLYSINPPHNLEVVLDNTKTYNIEEKIDVLDVKKLAPKYSKIEIFVEYSW